MIKRYRLWLDQNGVTQREQSVSGHWVLATDYDALAARLAELVALLRSNPNAFASEILTVWLTGSASVAPDAWTTHTKDADGNPCVTEHSLVVGGVLCRWWGDGEPPEGVAAINRAACPVCYGMGVQKMDDGEPRPCVKCNGRRTVTVPEVQK